MAEGEALEGCWNTPDTAVSPTRVLWGKTRHTHIHTQTSNAWALIRSGEGDRWRSGKSINPTRWRNSFSVWRCRDFCFLLQAIYSKKIASVKTVRSEKRVRRCMLTRRRLMYGDRLSAVSGERCVFVSSADGRLTANKIFKARLCDRESDVMSRKCSRESFRGTEEGRVGCHCGVISAGGKSCCAMGWGWLPSHQHFLCVA